MSRATPLVLASASPQRREMLARVGIGFEIRPTGVEELTEGDPRAVAGENARRKASAVRGTGSLVLGADTVVAVGARLLGKPVDASDAREHLRALSGRVHHVYGGIALVSRGDVLAEAVEVTAVRFRELDDGLVEWYVSTGEWRERAGGYAIQGAGAALVRRVEGDYSNVVGLPLARLLDLAPDLLPGGRAPAPGAGGPEKVR